MGEIKWVGEGNIQLIWGAFLHGFTYLVKTEGSPQKGRLETGSGLWRSEKLSVNRRGQLKGIFWEGVKNRKPKKRWWDMGGGGKSARGEGGG